jgi:hypothetical protein
MNEFDAANRLLIQVNDHDLRQVTHADAVTVLCSVRGCDVLKFEIERDPEEVRQRVMQFPVYIQPYNVKIGSLVGDIYLLF